MVCRSRMWSDGQQQTTALRLVPLLLFLFVGNVMVAVPASAYEMELDTFSQTMAAVQVTPGSHPSEE